VDDLRVIMHCDSTDKISSLIDGELEPAEVRALERHLLTCVACQEARADFLSLRNQLSAVAVPFNPVAQREALARILGNASAGRTNRKSAWGWVSNPAVAAVAMLFLVGTVIALFVYPRLKPNKLTSNEIARGNTSIRPAPVASPSVQRPEQTGKEENKPAPKSSPAPATNDRSTAPKKKRVPLIVEPSQDNIARNTPKQDDPYATAAVRSADAETMTAIHFQKSELLLLSFRNVRMNNSGRTELRYEKRLAQQLVYQNMLLRREADASGDAQVSSLLESLEPILLDIANLSDRAQQDDVRVIKNRVERKNIVALLQVNSAALARGLD